MKKLISLLLTCCLLLTLAACTNSNAVEEENQHNTLPGEVTEINSIAQSEALTQLPSVDLKGNAAPLKAEYDSICNKYGAEGVQVAVIKDGKLFSAYEYGIARKEGDVSVTADTKFRIASLSKLVTDIVFMRLCEEGKVDLGADISTYLGFKVRNPHHPESVITPAMLMSHTSSIIDSETFLSSRLSGSSERIEKLLERNDSFSSSKPGAEFSYSNFSVALIGSICEKATGKAFDALAHEYIFNPLGIDASYLASNLKNQSLLGELYGMGGYSVEQQMSQKAHNELGQTHHLVQGNLTISAKDYINIAAVLCNGGVAADGTRLLSKESVDKMLADPVGFGFTKNEGLAENKVFCTHTGSNFGMFSSYAIDPESGLGVVVLSTGTSGTKNNPAGLYDVCYDIIKITIDSQMK
ncbi:MAG: beta-lactamase family protein [Clostridia bacterium]|nr:beta-lactamase family protein [Clostridia bacterium]